LNLALFMGKLTKFVLSFILILLYAMDLHAQINECNVFIQNNYVEVGVNWNGAYGSSATPPSGYHPDTLSSFYSCSVTSTSFNPLGVIATGSALGFVADVDKDGWATGTPPYYGDYILPGSHQEGWSFMADGTQINEWNYLAADSSVLEGGMVPYDIEYMSGPTGDTSKWEGEYNDQFYIVQFTVLDTSKLFFTVYMSIVNTSLSPSNNVYYMRTIKSNNDALLSGGGYTTRNKIDEQLPNTYNATVVSSASTLYPEAYVALGTNNLQASSFIIKNGVAPFYNTIDNISAGIDTNYLYTLNDSLTNTGGIGIIFNLGTLPGSLGEDDFSFVYAFTPQALNQALGMPDSTNSNVGVKNVIATNYTLFPNPVKSAFTVSGMENGSSISMYDALGRMVTQKVSKTGLNTFTTDNLSTGFYILMVKDADGNIQWKTPLEKQ